MIEHLSNLAKNGLAFASKNLALTTLSAVGIAATGYTVSVASSKIFKRVMKPKPSKIQQQTLITAKNIKDDLKAYLLDRDISTSLVLRDPKKALMYSALLKITSLLFTSIFPMISYGVFWGSFFMIDLVACKKFDVFWNRLSSDVYVLNTVVGFYRSTFGGNVQDARTT